MELTTCGAYSEMVQEKNNLYSLKRKLLVNKYYNKKNNIQNEILKELKQSIKNLKQIEKIESNSNIEYKIYKTTSKPAGLWQEKIINVYKFFGTMLGIIDGQLDRINRDINFELNFVDDKTSKLNIKNNADLNYLLNQKEQFLTYRNIIVEEYKGYNTTIEPQSVNNAINNYPSHQYFNECFKDIEKNSYSLNLQVEFITAYNKGYTAHNKIDFDEIYNEFNILFNELKQFKEHLNTNEEKIIIKKKRV